MSYLTDFLTVNFKQLVFKYTKTRVMPLQEQDICQNSKFEKEMLNIRMKKETT